MALETYFDFDAETFQINERKRLSRSSVDVSLSPRLTSTFLKSTSSEDTGFETSSNRSSLSQDGLALLESPRSPCPRSAPNELSWSACSRASLDSLVSRPLRRFDSKESINSTSSFWEGNFPPETKAVLMKIRDQMRSSLEKVKKLEDEVKQIPLLQVKVSILQEEKRQLMSLVESRSNVRKSRSRSGSVHHSRSSSIDDLISSFQDKETRTIGVGNDTVHDILCEKCKEIQAKLLGRLHDNHHCIAHDTSAGVQQQLRQVKKELENDNEIKVYQNRCTQTQKLEHKNSSTQSHTSTRDASTCTNFENSSRVVNRNDHIVTKESSCDPIPIETRSIGVGQMGSFLKDACVGENKDLPAFKDSGVQNIVATCDESCGLQVTTQDVGLDARPAVVSVSTECFQENKLCFLERLSKRSTGSQTVKKSTSLVSIGVGMFSVDDDENFKCSRCKEDKSVSIKEILESNKSIFSDETADVAVGTCPWVDLERQLILEYQGSKSTSSVAMQTKIDRRSVGCGDQSITDSFCQTCVAKSSRSLGVNCTPKMSDRAVGVAIPSPETCSVGVGECCLTDNYCERCFSLHTRSIGVGNGSIIDSIIAYNDDTIPTSPEKPIPCFTSLNMYNEVDSPTSDSRLENTDLSPVGNMFSREHERFANEEIKDCSNANFCSNSFSSREDIVFTCKLLERHFQTEDGSLDEEQLLHCIKNIEDYWFSRVTDERLSKKSLSDLLHLLEQHLANLVDGVINAQDEHGNTALHYLVTYGKFDCVSALMNTNLCDVVITNKAGYSAVMLGSLKEALNPKDNLVLKRLFEKGNLNCIAQSTGQTALMLAAGTGNIETVELLLECGAATSINTADLVSPPIDLYGRTLI